MFTTMMSLFMAFSMTACGNAGTSQGQPMEQPSAAERTSLEENTSTEKEETSQNQLPEEETAMQVQVEANGNTTVFSLNDSQAARELYGQLPLTIDVENYSSDEKIFYPPEKLDVSDAPQANGVVGTLAYYAPWGDVVMFYGDFGSASGLYELGHAVSGSEFIETMSGVIEIIKSNS